ncbi:hypothetical protein KC363_g57 [Hortaea werneckii]|nr:hypothetical protein KC363_g57 [Hortaea werneckii]
MFDLLASPVSASSASASRASFPSRVLGSSAADMHGRRERMLRTLGLTFWRHVIGITAATAVEADRARVGKTVNLAGRRRLRIAVEVALEKYLVLSRRSVVSELLVRRPVKVLQVTRPKFPLLTVAIQADPELDIQRAVPLTRPGKENSSSASIGTTQLEMLVPKPFEWKGPRGLISKS